jgi:hypothetical protein
MYTSGTVGLYISQVSTTDFYDINIFNFDNAYGWDTVRGNNFCIVFKDSCIQGNNKGVTLSAAAPNSNEAQRWENCSISNNNYGIYLIAQTSASIGAGSALGLDMMIDRCQLDYNIVNAVYYLGFGAGSACPSTMFLHMCHVETNTTCSGTAVWMATDGIFFMDKCFNYCASGTPDGVVGTLGFWSTVNLTNNIQPGDNSTVIPLYYTPFGNLQGVYLAGNSCKVPSVPTIASTGSGKVFGQANMVLGNQLLTSNYTFNGQETNYPNGFLIGASINFTVPLASSFNYVIGTRIPLTSLATFTGTIVATGGVTITSSGTGLTFGGAKPATVFLTKVATNAWTATGNMN